MHHLEECYFRAVEEGSLKRVLEVEERLIPTFEMSTDTRQDERNTVSSKLNKLSSMKNDNQETPLVIACKLGHIDLVRFLVKYRGCRIDEIVKITDRKGRFSKGSSLFAAILSGNLSLVKCLVEEFGAQITKQMMDELSVSVSETQHPLSVQGSSCRSKRKPLDLPFYTLTRDKQMTIMLYLTQYGDASTRKRKPCPASKESNRQLEDSERPQKRRRWSNGDSAEFFTAVETNCVDQLEILKKRLMSSKGWPTIVNNVLNFKRLNGETPLLTACKHGHLDAVRYLVNDLGANVEQLVTIDYATFDGAKILDPITEKETIFSQQVLPLHAAVASGNLRLVRYLVEECKVDVNATSSASRIPPLNDLIRQEISLTSTFQQGENSPLHYAAYYFQNKPTESMKSIVRFLVDNGAKLYTLNRDGKFPWQITSNADAVDLFMELKMDLNGSLVSKREAGVIDNYDQIASVGFLGDTILTRLLDRYADNSFHKQFWKQVAKVRQSIPSDELPLSNDRTTWPIRIQSTFEGVSDLEYYRLDELRKGQQSAVPNILLAMFCILGPQSNLVRKALYHYIKNCYKRKDYQCAVRYSMLLFECCQTTEEPLFPETIDSLRILVEMFIHSNVEHPFLKTDATSINTFENIMSVLQTLNIYLSSDCHFKSDVDSRDKVREYALRLAMLLVSIEKSEDEGVLMKKCLQKLVFLDHRIDDTERLSKICFLYPLSETTELLVKQLMSPSLVCLSARAIGKNSTLNLQSQLPKPLSQLVLRYS